MERNALHENFEDFLKESADDVQMRPTAAVWRRIENRLNRRRRLVLFTSAFFLFTASLFGYLIIDHSKQVSDPFARMMPTIAKKAAVPIDENATIGNNKADASQPTQKTISSQKKTTVISRSGSSGSFVSKLFQNPIQEAQTASADDFISTAALPFTPTIVDEYEPFAGSTTPTLLTPNKKADSLTIESIVNSYRPIFKKRKAELQFFFTPTISYRRLSENKSYLRAVPQNQASLSLAALYDVNSMVIHKPDLGLELGFAYKFPVTSRIKLRAGAQFNINRYDIRAFTYVPERATIALNTRAGGRGVDSLNTMSSYRNFNGGREDWIQNFYFQVSTPVGVEVALNNSNKTRFGIATTIQPTYVLGDRAYLISTNYKNYSQVPWLTRRWNVNTSVETFVSYSTGKLRWQVGPQVRYQLLSSFVEKYPVKENLFDFGLKVGVSLDKK